MGKGRAIFKGWVGATSPVWSRDRPANSEWSSLPGQAVATGENGRTVGR
jgi:hypothetical protein